MIWDRWTRGWDRSQLARFRLLDRLARLAGHLTAIRPTSKWRWISLRNASAFLNSTLTYSLGGGFINLWFDQTKMKEIGITNQNIAEYLRSLTAREYYGPSEKWPVYLAYRPDERLFFNAYTYEQVEAFVKANPRRWMANPYVGEGTAVTLEHDLQRLYYAVGSGMGYLAYGAHVAMPTEVWINPPKRSAPAEVALAH